MFSSKTGEYFCKLDGNLYIIEKKRKKGEINPQCCSLAYVAEYSQKLTNRGRRCGKGIWKTRRTERTPCIKASFTCALYICTHIRTKTNRPSIEPSAYAHTRDVSEGKIRDFIVLLVFTYMKKKYINIL